MRCILLLLAAFALVAAVTAVPVPSGVYARTTHDVNTTLAPGAVVNVTATCASGKVAQICSCNFKYHTAQKPDPSPTDQVPFVLDGRNCTCVFGPSDFTFPAFEWSFITWTDCVPE